MKYVLIILEQYYNQLIELMAEFAQYGPFAGILLTMVEAFFPPFPLVVFVTINIIAYGFWLGYIYSFIGTFIGSWLMFLIIRRFGRGKFQNLVHRHRRLDNLLHWINEKGFMPIFILLTFPFTPSIIICGLAGLADVKIGDYVLALFLGKLLMVFSFSFIGYNVSAFISKPIRSIILILVIILFSYIGKRLIGWYEKKIALRRSKKI